MKNNNELRNLTVIEAINTVDNFNIALNCEVFLNIDFVNKTIKEIKEVLDNFELLEYLLKLDIKFEFKISEYEHFSVTNDNKKLEIYIPRSLAFDYFRYQDNVPEILNIIKSFINETYTHYFLHKQFLESKLCDVVKR